jgi:hypothetical protein
LKPLGRRFNRAGSEDVNAVAMLVGIVIKGSYDHPGP